MNIKNYTSEISPLVSVARIEKALVEVGAVHIAKTYENGNLTGVTFQIEQSGRPFVFKLPANVEAVESIFLEQIKRRRKGTEQKMKEQAQRTAWKLLLDWVEVQASLILIGRRMVIEVFLPYLYDMNKSETLFEQMRANNFKMLGSGK